MRGVIGGILVGGVVSVIGLGVISVLSEQPPGRTPPAAPLIDAPQSSDAPREEATSTDGPASSPVGAVTIEAPQAPPLPEGEAEAISPPAQVAPETAVPLADTDPLKQPDVLSIEGAMPAPDTSDGAGFSADPVEPVLPNPQGQAPQTPDTESNLTISTTPSQQVVVVEPDRGVTVDTTDTPEANARSETFVVDLGTNESDDAILGQNSNEDAATGAPDTQNRDSDTAAEAPAAARLQMQGGANTLLSDRDTGVTIRRPASESQLDITPEAAAVPIDALELYAAKTPDTGDTPLMSIVLIDDGKMSAAAAALAGVPFAITIGLDSSLPNAAELMASYRASGYEVVALAKLPEGAMPSDVEITFESVFGTLPESIAVLDIGNGGLQSDRDVTAQAMEVLAAQGRGFVTTTEGLNMAGRAAAEAGVPAATVFRDLDSNGQDARVVRRFVDQAAFRARQESGVVLIGRVRPETISALILWGTANGDKQVALVPLSTVLLAQ